MAEIKPFFVLKLYQKRMSGVAGELIKSKQKTMEETRNDKVINKISEKKQMDFEAKQNAVGFFSLLLEVAKRNPELWKQICNKNNEDNRNTNRPD